MAYTLGEEYFVDSDGDGYFASDETHADKGEAFLDLNDDDQLDLEDPVESKTFFVDWNNSGEREETQASSQTPLAQHITTERHVWLIKVTPPPHWILTALTSLFTFMTSQTLRNDCL